jgi:hypothetical protein
MNEPWGLRGPFVIRLRGRIPHPAGYPETQCDNIPSIDKRQLDRAVAGRMGALDEMAWREVVKAIGYVAGSDCEST